MFGIKRRAVEACLASSRLPVEITQFIAGVVRRTRLRGAEQIDVAGELVSHFAEGLATGKSASDLIRTYGDPSESARAIRRSTIAKRGAFDRAVGTTARFAFIGGTVAAAAYCAAATILYFKQPVIAFDGVQAINAQLPKVGSEGRALDVYIKALGGDAGIYDEARFAGSLDRIERSLPLLEHDAAAREETRAALAEIEDEISILRAVKDRPALGFEVTATGWRDTDAARFFRVATDADISDPSGSSTSSSPFAGTLLSVLLPQLSVLRTSARLLCADAALAIADGRVADFMADIEATNAAANHVGETTVLIAELVEIAMRGDLMANTVISAIENHAERFSDQDLARLNAIFSANNIDIARAMTGERWMFDDLVQRCYSDDGSGDGVPLAHAYMRLLEAVHSSSMISNESPREGLLAATGGFLAGPAAAAILPSRREVMNNYNAHMDRFIAATNAPTREESERLAKEAGARIESEDSRFAFVKALFPSLDRAATMGWAARARANTALAAIGIERFRRANARFPNDLAELVAFIGQPIESASFKHIPWKYALIDGRPLLFDAGCDALDDRARTALWKPPEVDLDTVTSEELAQRSNDRFVSLRAAQSDRFADGGSASPGNARYSLRTSSTVAADQPLDPTQPVVDVDATATMETDGDFIRVWWKSGAAGWDRVAKAAMARTPEATPAAQ